MCARVATLCAVLRQRAHVLGPTSGLAPPGADVLRRSLVCRSHLTKRAPNRVLQCVDVGDVWARHTQFAPLVLREDQTPAFEQQLEGKLAMVLRARLHEGASSRQFGNAEAG